MPTFVYGFGGRGAGEQDLDMGTDDVRSLQRYAQVAIDYAFGDAFRPVQAEVRIVYAHEMLDANRAVDVAAQDVTLLPRRGRSCRADI
jgi:fibronectin-binding autotransporter adhesin